MLTNKHVVLSHNYPLEASIVVVSFVTPGLRTRTFKFDQANSQLLGPFGCYVRWNLQRWQGLFQGMRRRLTYFSEWSYSSSYWIIGTQLQPIAFLFTGDSFIYLEWKLHVHWISESKFGEQFLRITDDGSNTPETSLMLDVT